MAASHGDFPVHSDCGAVTCRTCLEFYEQETEKNLYETLSVLHFVIVTE